MKNKKVVRKLILKDKDFKLVLLKTIITQDKVVYIDEVKGKFKILVSNFLMKDAEAIKSIIYKDKKIYIDDLVFPISKGTKLNISKQLIYIEEYKDSYRLTFSTAFINSAEEINFQIGV